jgi:hypothetical protein
MHPELKSPVLELIENLEHPDHIDLDQLRRKLTMLSTRWQELAASNQLYEAELQRELRAKIDLGGGLPGCPDINYAAELSGEELLSARRAASLQFNRVFHMAPLTRNSRPEHAERPRNGRRNPEHDVRQRAQKNL